MNLNNLISETMEHRKPMIRKAKPIVDLDIIKSLNNIEYVTKTSDLPIIENQFEFLDLHRNWIKSSKNFKISGLSDFESLVTYGVTDAFNDFYFLNKQIYVMRGEYTYHRDLGYPVIDDIYKIPSYTALIISYPFSATGNVHPDWENILKVCEERSIKLFVDCCLFGISKVDKLDLSSPCITHVAFSFSKTFATAGNRTGVLYTRDKTLTPLKNQNGHFYTNMIGQRMHMILMSSYSPDYVYDKYRSKQLELCSKFGIDASDSVIFGTSHSQEFDYFERDKYINRICITYSLQKFDLPLEF